MMITTVKVLTEAAAVDPLALTYGVGVPKNGRKIFLGNWFDWMLLDTVLVSILLAWPARR